MTQVQIVIFYNKSWNVLKNTNGTEITFIQLFEESQSQVKTKITLVMYIVIKLI